MAWSALLVFAATLVLAAGTPGPSVAALVSRALASGLRDVLPFCAAKWIGEILWLTLAIAEQSVVAQKLGTVLVVLRYLGAAYLLFLAWQMWSASIDLAGDARPPARHPSEMFMAGLLVTLGNPEVMVFYTELLPTVVGLHQLGPLGSVSS